MHICVYVPNGVFSLLILSASTGTAVQYTVYPTFTRSSTTRLATAAVHSNRAAAHYIHYTVMCSEAPLSKRWQSGGRML